MASFLFFEVNKRESRACSSVRSERTPDKREADGSIPSRPTISNEEVRIRNSEMKRFRVPDWTIRIQRGGLAQLGERLPCTQEVSGSTPLSSMFKRVFKSWRVETSLSPQ